MIDEIREELHCIKSITLQKMQINFGKENIIEIKIKKVADFPKWDYFCERLSKNCDAVHIIKKYPTLIFKMPIESNALSVGLQGFDNALKCKYYLINKPKQENITIITKVTNLCNLDCQYCYDKPFRDKLGHNGFLDLDKLDHMIDMASKHAEKVTVLWHGGEPTLVGIDYYRKVFDEILPKYPYTTFDIDIQTNGTLIDDKWIDFCKEVGINIGSSYNATQEDLRQNYTGEGDKAETNLIMTAFENIKHAIKEGVSSGVIDVLTKENHGRLKEIYEFYKKEGVDACFNEINDAGEASKHEFLFVTPKDQQQYKDTTIDYFTYWLNDKDERCFIDRYTSEYVQMVLTGQTYVCHNGNGCLFHWIGINSNGDLYPCDRALPEKYRIGNVMDFNSIQEIYDSSAYQNYATERNLKLDNVCSRCNIQYYCGGNCPMIDIDVTGDASKPNTYACQMQKLNMECAYSALFNTDIEKCNDFMRLFLINNCVFLPKEIPVLLKKLGVAEQFKDYDYESESARSMKSKEFKLFVSINSPDKNEWISKEYFSLYDRVIDPNRVDDRFEVAIKELKDRAEYIQNNLLQNK